MINTAEKTLMNCPPWKNALAIQQDTVRSFHQACTRALADQVQLNPLTDKNLSLQRNLFSTLFIMANEAAGVSQKSLPFFAMVFQCMRAQVTGCDNLLDDEFKSVIPFALPGSATRFRSVLTIMTSDMVLADRAIEEIGEEGFSQDMARQLLREVLALLLTSGLQEDEEESLKNNGILTATEVLEEVHPRKTGSLFSAPVLLAERLGAANPARCTTIARALGNFGIGCQILDDLKDVMDDLLRNRNNIVISIAYHYNDEKLKKRIDDFFIAPPCLKTAERITKELDKARMQALQIAGRYFKQAEQELCLCIPGFGPDEVQALGSLIHASIMGERNDFQEAFPQ